MLYPFASQPLKATQVLDVPQVGNAVGEAHGSAGDRGMRRGASDRVGELQRSVPAASEGGWAWVGRFVLRGSARPVELAVALTVYGAAKWL